MAARASSRIPSCPQPLEEYSYEEYSYLSCHNCPPFLYACRVPTSNALLALHLLALVGGATLPQP